MVALLRRAIGSLAVRLAITAAILAYLASRIDMGAATLAVLRIDPWALSLVLLLVALDRAVMILRWYLLLKASGVAISAAQASHIFLVSSFVGSFLPAGVGGDMARAYSLSRANARGSEAVASVAIDRVLGVLALVLMGALGLVAWTPAGGDWRLQLTVAVMLLAGASVAILWADRVVRLVVPAAWHSSRTGIKLLRLGDALSRYRGRSGTLLHVLGWSLAVQVLRIVQAYVLGLGLGLTVPFRYYLVFMPVGLLMLLLPISVSGFGLPQGVIVWLLQPMGVPDEQSFALSTLIVLTGLAGNLPGLLLWLRQRREIQ